MTKDYYDTLGVYPDAPPHEIKRAYHDLAHVYHPDHNSGPGAAAHFKEIAEAYSVLMDPERRAAYDQRLGLTSTRPSWHGGLHLGVDLGILRFSVGLGQVEEPTSDDESRQRDAIRRP